MSYEEFLNTYCNNEHLEWVDGEVVQMPPVTGAHSLESNSLIRWVGEWVEHFDLGEIHADPFQIKTGSNLPGCAPDMIFVATQNLHRLHSLYLEGPADVAIEIISPSSVRVDRIDKFSEYEAASASTG